jgi:hypothetical protein
MADEIQVDIEELDHEAAKAAAKAKTNGAADPEIAADAEKSGDSAVITPESGLEKLKKQLADEQAARRDADRRAAEAAESEARARGDAQTTQLDLIKSAIAQTTQANDALEAKYAEALSTQDFAVAAKINREMATNSARLLALENGKTQLEKAPKPTARAPVDQVEEFASRCTPLSAQWVREHPDFVRDPNKNRQMIAAHELAMGRGIKADTDEYFASIEDTLRLRKQPEMTSPDKDDDDPMKDAARPRAKAPPGAPVTRSGNGTGGRANTVTLSAAQVEAAAASGLTPEEYARNLLALKNEGRLN